MNKIADTSPLRFQDKYPWRLVPAHIALHIGLFAGVLIRSLDKTVGNLEGMDPFIYDMWIVIGLISFPLIALSYCVIYFQKGLYRYIALWIHFLGNFGACFAIAAYCIAAYNAGVINTHGHSIIAWTVTIAGGFFGLSLVISDIVSIRKVERLATFIKRRESNG